MGAERQHSPAGRRCNRIPYYKNRVQISGNVKRDGKYEMLDNESFSNLLTYCGGFTDNAFRGEVTLVRITDKVKKIIDIDHRNKTHLKQTEAINTCEKIAG